MIRFRILALLAAALLSLSSVQNIKDTAVSAVNNVDRGFIEEQKYQALQALNKLRSLGLSPEGLVILLRGGDPSEDAQNFAEDVYESITEQIGIPETGSGDGTVNGNHTGESGAGFSEENTHESGDGAGITEGSSAGFGTETLTDELLRKADELKNDAVQMASEAGSEAAQKVQEAVDEEKESFVEYAKERLRKRLHDFVDEVL